MQSSEFLWPIAVMVLCLAAAQSPAQQQIRARRISPPTESNMQGQRRQDEESIEEMPDPGFDFAIVTAPQANIREEPTLSSRVLLRVKRGEVLAIVEREPEGTWFQVIHIDSATEGWMDQSVIVKRFTRKARAAPTLQAEKTGTFEDPEIRVINDAYLDLNLRVGVTLYVVPTKQQRTLTLSPGNHKFYGYAPGVSPAFGEKTFEVGHRYTWTFWIETRRVR
jgi:uncharacterized protein YgiM (DUF1202 family)